MPNCLLHCGHTKTRLCPAWYLVSSNVIKLSHLGHLTLFMRLFFYEGYPSVGKGLVMVQLVECCVSLLLGFIGTIDHLYIVGCNEYSGVLEALGLQTLRIGSCIALGNTTCQHDAIVWLGYFLLFNLCFVCTFGIPRNLCFLLDFAGFSRECLEAVVLYLFLWHKTVQHADVYLALLHLWCGEWGREREEGNKGDTCSYGIAQPALTDLYELAAFLFLLLLFV